MYRPASNVGSSAQAISVHGVVPKIESVFWWEGKIQHDQETLLIIKTTQLKVESMIGYVQENHPYDVPEIITLSLAEGLPDYLNWVIDEMAKETGQNES